MRGIVTRPFAAAVSLCAGIALAGAWAQAGTSNPVLGKGPTHHSQVQPSPDGTTTVPEQQPQSGSSTAPGSLSHELSRSGGVIHPPPTGDGGVVAPPNQGTSRTPVIPPPGTPGGNPLVQPK